METFFLILIAYVAGFIFGWFSHARSFISQILKNPDEVIRILDQYKKYNEPPLPNSREFKIERHNGQLYLYATDNGQFLAQAPTISEALTLVEQRFPNQNFRAVVSSAEADLLGFLKDEKHTV